MPIYEFVCNDCQHEFEELCRSSEEKSTCPQCSSAQVRRKFSAFATKGTGKKTASGSSASHSCGGCASKHCGSCGG